MIAKFRVCILDNKGQTIKRVAIKKVADVTASVSQYQNDQRCVIEVTTSNNTYTYTAEEWLENDLETEWKNYMRREVNLQANRKRRLT